MGTGKIDGVSTHVGAADELGALIDPGTSTGHTRRQEAGKLASRGGL